MLNKLQAMLRRYEMVQPGDTVICAVSGGADSVALLFALHLLKDNLSITLEAAHFNHGLRGAESDRDEAFVGSLCQRYDIPLHVQRGAVMPGKKGLEAAARDARYAYFETLPGKIATAHTADDNAETVLMHMVRGTGLKGLGAIAPVRGRYIRPMLLITRQQVLEFLEEYHLEHITDSSNASDAFLRNRLRHHVMPLLAVENPCLAESMSEMALRLRQDEQALCADLEITQTLSVKALRDMPAARRSRLLMAFLERCGVREPTAEHICLAESLVFSPKPSARASFPGGVVLSRAYDCLMPLTAVDALCETQVPCPGEVVLSQLGLRLRCERANSIVNTADTFTVAAQGKIYLRSRRAGDRLRLSGGTKTLKELFIDRKIPAHERLHIPVLADSQGVLGVWGIGVNQDRAAEELPAWQLRWERLDDTEKSVTEVHYDAEY